MLVEIIGKRNEENLITTSLKVAEVFEKEHKDVLESIRNLVAENSAAKFFNETTYKLEILAKPLIDFLKNNYHPHTAILITDERVAVVETILSIPQPIDG